MGNNYYFFLARHVDFGRKTCIDDEDDDDDYTTGFSYGASAGYSQYGQTFSFEDTDGSDDDDESESESGSEEDEDEGVKDCTTGVDKLSTTN